MEREQWDERYRADELNWIAEPNRFLVEEVAGRRRGRALDLACGEGRNALWLAQRGWRVTAVDFSAVGLEKDRWPPMTARSTPSTPSCALSGRHRPARASAPTT